MNPIFTIVVIIIIIVLILYFLRQNKIEGYNDQTGRYCISCSDKTFNNCLNCFNCGWCVDNFGNGMCIGGDHRGPYNYENCAKWFRRRPKKSCSNKYISGCIGYKVAECNKIGGFASESNIDATRQRGSRCQRWYHGDPFSYMLQKKQQRKDSYCLL